MSFMSSFRHRIRGGRIILLPFFELPYYTGLDFAN